MYYARLIPHFLSASRFFIGSFLVAYLLLYGVETANAVFLSAALCLYIVFALTDFFDGYCARALGVASPMGSILDLMADKFYFTAIAFVLVLIGDLPLWILLLFYARELIVIGVRLLIALEHKPLPAVLFSAKLKTTFQSIFIASAIAAELFHGNEILHIVAWASMLDRVILFIIFSILVYILLLLKSVIAMDIFLYFMCLGAAYIIGAFPSGYYVAQLYGITITQHGSGNIGATNVGRVLGKKFFFLVLLFDVAKAYLFLSLVMRYSVHDTLWVLSGLMLVLGNSFSIFLDGRGGKTVATGIGVLLALAPSLFMYIAGAWAVAFMCTKTVGIASVVAFVSAPIIGYGFAKTWPALYLLLIVMSFIGIVRHKNNIYAWLHI